MFNRSLNELKKIFDRIESYNPNQNIGLRPLKNIGVWLCVYALTDDHHKILVINELAPKAGLMQQSDINFMKSLADELSDSKTLATIISDYEIANGSFTLTVNSEKNLGLLTAKIKEKNYEDLLQYIALDTEQKADLIFLMNNSIKFNWAATYRILPAELIKIKDTFRGEVTDFLEANTDKHGVIYGIIEHNQRLFHAVRLNTLEIAEGKKNKGTHTYLIESVDPNDAIYLQKEYFDIIDQIKYKQFDHENTMHILQNNKLAAKNVSIKGQFTGGAIDFMVRFPKILDTLSTTEQRLGIYENFVYKNIANIKIDRIEYLGKRELTYDEKGGAIKNREEVKLFSIASCDEPLFIQYTIANPFMMVYEAENGADYYPYFIANPRQNLQMTFEKNETYPDQQKLVGFASAGNSMFSQNAGNVIINNNPEKIPESIRKVM